MEVLSGTRETKEHEKSLPVLAGNFIMIKVHLRSSLALQYPF